MLSYKEFLLVENEYSLYEDFGWILPSGERLNPGPNDVGHNSMVLHNPKVFNGFKNTSAAMKNNYIRWFRMRYRNEQLLSFESFSNITKKQIKTIISITEVSFNCKYSLYVTSFIDSSVPLIEITETDQDIFLLKLKNLNRT